MGALELSFFTRGYAVYTFCPRSCLTRFVALTIVALHCRFDLAVQPFFFSVFTMTRKSTTLVNVVSMVANEKSIRVLPIEATRVF